GSLTLSGNNSYTGVTTLTSGKLNVNSPTAIGMNTLAVSSAATIDNTSGAGIVLTNNNPLALGNNLTFIGSNDLSFGTGSVSFATARTVTVRNHTLTVGPVISTASLTKQGNGTLSMP